MPSIRMSTLLIVMAVCVVRAPGGTYAEEGSGAQNGIYVGEPKTYDVSALESMLQAAQARLRSLQFIDQASIARNLASLQGGRGTSSGFAIQLSSAPVPGTSTKTMSGPAGTPVSSETDTTQPAYASNIPTLTQAAGGLAFPAASAFAPSAIDSLADAMQANYEAAGISLLLENAFSDRVVKGGSVPKQRAVIGLPVTIIPPAGSKYENAVAEVEVTVTLPKQHTDDEQPGLVTILPREKTYNTVELTDGSKSVGAALTWRVFTVGGAGSRTTKTYYLVRDVDTVAYEKVDMGKSLIFGWQFRPVLGHKTVTAGLRQMFAEVTLPVAQDQANLCDLEVVTRWKRFKPSTGAVGGIIRGSKPSTQVVSLTNPNRTVKTLGAAWVDAGDGRVAVHVEGAMQLHSRVAVGSTWLDETVPGFQHSPNGSIRFVAPAAQVVAAEDVYIVSPSGDQVKVQIPSPGCGAPNGATTIESVGVTPYSVTDSFVTIAIRQDNAIWDKDRPLVLVGDTVFGLSDRPFHSCEQDKDMQSMGGKITFVAPTTLLRNANTVTVRHLFCGPHSVAHAAIKLEGDFTATQAVVLRSNDKSGTEYAVIGSGLATRSKGSMTPAVEVLVNGKSVATKALSVNMLSFFLDTATSSGLKRIVVTHEDAQPVVLSLDSPPARRPEPDALDAVPLGYRNRVKITGKNLDLVDAVFWDTAKLNVRTEQDGAYLTVEVDPRLTAHPGYYALTVLLKDKSTMPLVLHVVGVGETP